jgi:hypothetical protein
MGRAALPTFDRRESTFAHARKQHYSQSGRVARNKAVRLFVNAQG